ncbi:MAG: hypothetical protein IPP85_18945 [Propionivibrio sp.]|nr:hypothetical protein [Propionivibrio sp.]
MSLPDAKLGEKNDRAFVGPVGTSTLIDNINKAESHLELRAVFDDWQHVHRQFARQPAGKNPAGEVNE